MKENNNSSMRGRFLFIFLAIVMIGGIWFLFLRTSDMGAAEAGDVLIGDWQRADGPYTIEINEVGDDGKMTAAYFNPGPIHVGRSGWRIKDDKLQIYVELQDENYPGSVYELIYNIEKNQLTGNYYQAVTKQTYSVVFDKD